jgi:hypothetical protein
MINAQSKPKTTVVDSASSMPSTSAGCASPVYTGRVRDRQNAEANQPVEVKQESQYEQELRLYGKEWATVWRDQREADSREKRIAAEAARVKAAHREADARERRQREADALAAKRQREQAAQIIFDNADRKEIKDLLKSEPADVIDRVIQLTNGSKLPFVWKACLDTIKQQGGEK